MSKIIWLSTKQLTAAAKGALNNFFLKRGINKNDVFFLSFEYKFGVKGLEVQSTKTKKSFNFKRAAEFEAYLKDFCDRLGPTILVCNDENLCEFFTGKRSTDVCRGFVYRWQDWPILIVDQVSKIHTVKWGSWLLHCDIARLKRWCDGTQRTEPAFSYNICKTRGDLSKLLQDFRRDCIVTSIDIETAAGFITSISFTCLANTGVLHTTIIPFYSTQTISGAYWENEDDEVFAWSVVKEICESDVPKIFQNGQYDCSWFIRYRIAVVNYYLDPLHLFHANWPEARKRLNNITAYCLDFSMFWKEESKSDKQDVKKFGRVPLSKEGYERYLRYNGLDTHYTMLNCLYLILIITHPTRTWALQNYVSEFEDQVGPAMFMSMRGLKRSIPRWKAKKKQLEEKYKQSLADLRTMCDDPEYNPESNPQTASLIYDVLGAQPIQIGSGKHKSLNKRTVDEKILRLIRVQHPIYAWYIDKLWDVKKTRNNISKYIMHSEYGDVLYPHDRLLYQLWAAGTENFRYASKEHQWWYGTNAQNIPKDIRDMFVADDGYFFFDVDYSQSDAWFVAFESGDGTLINELEGDKDAHCLLAEFIFQKPYEKIYQGHLNDEDWVEHPTEGVRQNTKRIRHGANYRMAGFTLYVLMGHEAAVATARAMGHKAAHTWERKQLINFCGQLIAKYYQRYNRIPGWFKQTVKEAIANGNRASTFNGLTRFFFGDIQKDDAIQRELSAFFGQGGTGANIRRANLSAFYESDLEKEGARLCLQVHDSNLWQIPFERFDLCRKILTIMAEPCTIKGRSFVIPTDAKCGLSWGRGMMKWTEDVTMNDIILNEGKWEEKMYNGFREAA